MKHVSKSTSALLVALALVCSLFAGRAHGQNPIQGKIDFGGVVTFDTTSLATATEVDLWNSSFVLQRFGDFTAFTNPGDNVSMSAPWIFTPSTPLPSLWMVGGFTFDLTSSIVVTQTPRFLNVQASGILSGNGFDPTPATWTFSASRGDGGNANTFGFQSTTSAVPESSTVALLGIGAFALGVSVWRRRQGRIAPVLSR